MIRFCIYWTLDGTRDTDTVKGATTRDAAIKNLKELGATEICWCRIYASGEYSRRIWV